MKDKKVKSNIISIVLLLIILACVIYLGRYFYVQHQSKKLYEQMQEEVLKKPTATPSTAPTKEVKPTNEPETTAGAEPTEAVKPQPTDAPVITEEPSVTDSPVVTEEPKATPTPYPAEISVDFEALWDINDHAYAWIYIPGTDISYPILQHPKENAYYLERTIDGKKGLPGAIYTHGLCNKKSFNDFNTVIYGHNMRVETMFGKLKYYREESFFEEHNTIQIYLPEKMITYEVVAAVEHSDMHLSYEYNFRKDEGRQAFITDILNAKGRIDSEAELTIADKYITLSTCISDQPTKRFLVVAKRVN